MELNGVANIKVLVEMAVGENVEHRQQIDPSLADNIIEQCALLERYLRAYQKAAKSTVREAAYIERILEIKPPLWHEVKAEPTKYPNIKEKNDEGANRL